MKKKILVVILVFILIIQLVTNAFAISELRKGSKGDEVVVLQEYLISQGYLNGKADGDYGKMTEAAVIAFQKANGLSETGIADEATQTALANREEQRLANLILSSGSKGNDVIKLQKRLIELGYLSDDASGFFDVITEAAIVVFQSHNGLTPNGVADKTVRDALYAQDARGINDSIIEVAPSSSSAELSVPGTNTEQYYSQISPEETFITGHFVVSVPSNWIHVRNDDNGFDYYYAKVEGKIDGGYLGIKQDNSMLQYSYLTGSGIDNALDSIAEGILGDKTGIVEHTTVNGLPAITVRYAASATQYYNLIAVFHEGYLLSVGYLDENYDSDKTWEIAQRFFSTINLANNSEGTSDGSSPTETAYVVYPRSFTSSLEQYAIPLPEICYTTPASENGYEGLPSYVEGIVTKVYSDGEVYDNAPKIILLTTDYGPVFFQVMSPDHMLTYNSNPILNTESGRQQFFALYDQTMDYAMPEEGESVRVYGVYMGYSSVMEAGALIFGLDDFLYTTFYGEYDPSKFNQVR